MRKFVLILAAVLTTTLNVVPASATASPATRASCLFRVHIMLSHQLQRGTRTAGTFRSTTLGSVDCAGTFGGTLTDGAGWVQASGSYKNGNYNPLGNPLDGFDSCALGTGNVSFLATTPVFLSNRRPIKFDGTVHLAPIARALFAAGSGRAGLISPLSPGSSALSYTGIGSFTPDHGQDCATVPIRSGTLAETLVIEGSS
jgi:hypothetical protein